MTAELRRDIFSKECLSIEDIGLLFDLDYNTASEKIREWKRRLEMNGKALRIDIRGKIHTQDYMDVMGVSGDRYSLELKGVNNGKQQETYAG